ncbi:hypothetical protein PLICRDRAFT_131582 [Plicaturopsis crispa FD-325 SS-3]|nr:hypothetical protein PLICRDRAFT_131582 [Plicaturopsis crispa FD-325 SS-3]
MPPKKGRGIVSSGNAGNSSKSKPTAVPSAASSGAQASEVEKPLFPPGSKYPLSLLNERCQKNGWEKAIVDAVRRRQKDGFSFVVTLARLNKKNSTREIVRLEPHPPYLRPTAVEARHWGATYALYRFCNGMQLNRVLPPGPREYWTELAAEHKGAPEHMSWMYDADPFAARKAVDERQAKASKKREEASGTTGETSSDAHPRNAPVSGEFAQAPEVKMATGLREMVEEAVKKALSLYPEAGDVAPAVISEDSAPKIMQQLGHLGFHAAQAQKAVKFLSQPSALASNLLGSLSTLEAAIEYLVLHVPECDLPQRFLPAINSSNPFVTSAHSGIDDLKKRWIEDKAVKEAGWPSHVVKECTTDTRLLGSWELLIAALGRKLIGGDLEDLLDGESSSTSLSEKYNITEEETEALGATYLDPSHLVMTLFSAPVKLHLVLSSNGYPAGIVAPPMYITSDSVPAYVRLHLLAKLLREIQADSLVETGEGLLMASMRVLEDEWAAIETNGPPDISTVLQHLVPRKRVDSTVDQAVVGNAAAGLGDGRRKRGPPRRDPRSDGQIKAEFEALCQSDKYKKVYDARKKLPAFSAQDQFLEKLESSRVVVVVGETGCGKTTQLPQFILDSLILSNRGSTASIVVTQPRRISAISVAARVSSERLEDGSVGYAIRGESIQTPRTKLLFCTTGVVLRRLGSGDSLDGITHVIVDEVHERSVDGDFLLLELKELLKRHSTLKVILMSATINHETFVRYFNGAPLLEIPGFTHPVTDIYLEDVIPLIKYRPPMTKPGKKESDAEQRAFRDEFKSKGLDDPSVNAIQNISRSDRIDFQLVAAVVGHITSTAPKRGGILIFLPGVQEIRQCIDALRSGFASNEAEIFPLHANLSNEEQKRVFAPTSKWKVIAATNVAETSITIDDVIYVIDAGKVKETQYDPENSLSRLVESYVTRAAARQRRGRAGRTQPGTCYKLYTRKREEQMPRFPVPEILRVPLESISLTVKVMREEEDVKLFLSRAIDPPKIAAMEKAWSILEELGAVDESGKLTALGRHISVLPVDLRLAKMLVLGTVFQCLGPILTVAASLSSKPLFVSPMDKREEASQARARFATGGSDLLTDLQAYDACTRLRTEGKPQSAIRSFCEENFINANTIRDINSLRQDFLSSLSDLGFVPFSSTPSSPELNTNSGVTNLVKAIILGGLWPRVARVHLPKSAIKFDKVQAGTVQRENVAKEFKMYDLREGRVFLHPGSVLFGAAAWKSPFLAYFSKHATTKVFLRDATEVPLYALLLFGGTVSVNHIAGGVTVGTKDSWIKLKAWPRIGILVNQLRRLLDAQLQRCIEDGTMLNSQGNNPVLGAMLSLLAGDGLSG